MNYFYDSLSDHLPDDSAVFGDHHMQMNSKKKKQKKTAELSQKMLRWQWDTRVEHTMFRKPKQGSATVIKAAEKWQVS